MKPEIEDRSKGCVREDQSIWHYRDFAEFVSILQNGVLWFSRLDQLRDPFEGRSARARVSKFFAKAERHTRGGYVSCWSINESESGLMWLAYAPNWGVAIRSSKRGLIAALGQANVGKIVIGCINYDFVVPAKTSTLSEEEQLQAYPEVFRKACHFTGENELRAFIPPEELCVGDAKLGPEYDGKLVRLALPDLLCEVWVAPTAPYWFKPVVEAELSKYGYGAVPVRIRETFPAD